MARPAAEIEPQLLIFSSSRILPGPIRPFASRSIRTLRDGEDVDDDLRIMARWLPRYRANFGIRVLV